VCGGAWQSGFAARKSQKNNADPDSGKKGKYETEFPKTEFPYVKGSIVPQPEKRREWIRQVFKDVQEGEQDTEEQLNL
jgi:hypothetical protein